MSGNVIQGDDCVKIFIPEGGTRPRKGRPSDAGYDICPRAIVERTGFDSDVPYLAATVFDFISWPDDPMLDDSILEMPAHRPRRKDRLKESTELGTTAKRELIYRLQPGEIVSVGIGIVTEMSGGMHYQILPRSSLSQKYNIELLSPPHVIDANFRGEPRVQLRNNNRDRAIWLTPRHKIAQIIFSVRNPTIIFVDSYEELAPSAERGVAGLGSSGMTIDSPSR